MQPFAAHRWGVQRKPSSAWSHELGFWVEEGEKGEGLHLGWGLWGGANIGSGRC
ncbi:hypothetical protein PVOR_03250 [Paenibacillus vortex V453]|uniref:Uncharacterized protein n=1 Tax=Paenibacillus vortex V453 TaxID=715225 RepID=A0A2R9T105_9BACL|nr:hypothetical protein [Paenibacillus vortex]EFU43345.1 hypothetical protein PVOR_03250 [Paenibacillus vortex V453]